MTSEVPVVLVRGVRRAAFVEFEYSLAAGELAVELILPLGALEEFRLARCAALKFATPDAQRAYEALARLGPIPGCASIPQQ